MKQYGFNDYLAGCGISQPHLCILLGISKKTLTRYINENRAPVAIMLIMRSLNDGFPPIKNKKWDGYRIYDNYLVGPQGYRYYEHELRKIDVMRMNGFIPWHCFDDMEYAEWKKYIMWVNRHYIEYLKSRSGKPTKAQEQLVNKSLKQWPRLVRS